MSNLFSIVLPTYNRAYLIKDTIQSVMNQSYTNWELLVVDDGSTDNTKEVVSSFTDPRIRYIYQENAERSVGRNNGVRQAKGEWICFLDSDDYFLPDHLKAFNDFIEANHPGPSFLLTGGLEERDGEMIKKPLYDQKSGVHPAYFIFQNTLVTPISVCIHKSCFDTHQFLEKYKKAYWEDTHLWVRMALSFPLHQLPQYTNVLAEHKGRSVNSRLSMLRVNDHIAMIKHLFSNYKDLMSPVFSQQDENAYIDRKYRMFLYTARQNKQLSVALKIWWKGITHMFSLYFVSELPKILLNRIGIGIHGA